MNTLEALFNYCLRLADSNLILGQRLSEWCSNGPILEEDLAITNLALDHFGQAELFYEYAAEIKNNSVTPDVLAFQRSEREYFNCLLVELPNNDFAYTMMKQALYSGFAVHLYDALTTSADARIAALSAKAVKEMKYHFRHSSEWIIRLGLGTVESHNRMQAAADELWTYSADLFMTNETDKTLLNARISVNPLDFYQHWFGILKKVLDEASITLPQQAYMHNGGYNGLHTEHLGHLLCEMQYLQRAHPQAQW